MTAHILAIPADQLPPSVPLASQDSTLLDLPVLLLAPPEPVQSMVYASAQLDTSSPISALLPAQPDTDPLADSALSVLITAPHAQDPPPHAHHASTDMPLTQSLASVKLLPTANSDNTSLSHPTDAPAFAPPEPTTTSPFASLLASRATKTTELEDVFPSALKADAHILTT